MHHNKISALFVCKLSCLFLIAFAGLYPLQLYSTQYYFSCTGSKTRAFFMQLKHPVCSSLQLAAELSVNRADPRDSHLHLSELILLAETFERYTVNFEYFFPLGFR